MEVTDDAARIAAIQGKLRRGYSYEVRVRRTRNATDDVRFLLSALARREAEVARLREVAEHWDALRTSASKRAALNLDRADAAEREVARLSEERDDARTALTFAIRWISDVAGRDYWIVGENIPGRVYGPDPTHDEIDEAIDDLRAALAGTGAGGDMGSG